MREQSYRIHGMCCAEEVATVKRSLAEVVPADALHFDVLSGRMVVSGNVAHARVVKAVATTGMRAEPWSDVPPEVSWWTEHGNALLAATSGTATALGFAVHVALAGFTAAIGTEGMGAAETVPWVARFAYLVGIGAGLWVVLPKAWYAARTLRPDMNLLMTIAVVGALVIGEWFEAATVSFLFALSLLLESWSVGRARAAVSKLLKLAPDRVRVIRDGLEIEVPPQEVDIGTRFVVRPGERLGLDGRVVSGSSEVDQAPITGESMPVSKSPGSEVFAGTINGSGVLEITSTRVAADTTLAKIAALVGDAQKARARSEQWVERFARIYTPLILASALLVAVVPPLVGLGSWSDWTYRGLVLLVIGCPCALVISTPVSIVASLAAAARHGVLVKGGRFIEVPATLKVVAVDKTGTLTEGRPVVVEVVPLDGRTAEQLLTDAAAVNAQSEHPVGRAIVGRAEVLGLPVVPARAVKAVPGKGVTGRIGRQAYWLGSHRWLEERGQGTPELHRQLEGLATAGRTVVVVGTNDQVLGLIAVSDAVRPQARAAVAQLRAAGLRVVMLTGDNQQTGEAVGKDVGVDEVRAELLPADKVDAIVELGKLGPVAMVGDGVNDAPALARSALGIAMGHGGTDVAIETADVALMGDDLGKLAWLVGHSRATLAIIRQNAVFAITVKAVFFALTVGGVASMWGAIASDMGASLLVTFNALRLLRR